MASRSLVARLIWLLTSSMAGLWLLGSVTAGMLMVFEINERLDNAIEDVAQRLLPATYDAVRQPQAMQQMARQLVATLDRRSQDSGLSDHRSGRRDCHALRERA